MSQKHLCSLVATIVLAGVASLGLGSAPQEEPKASMAPDEKNMMEMMKKAKKFTAPGPMHKFLERFLGTWDTDVRITMTGHEAPPEKGVTETSWLLEGRWLKTEFDGSLMGQPFQSVSIMGYDNFKMSYVVTSVSSLDTAMNRSEGDLDPSGKVLILYGTIDEYLTGEHDKMVKTVWRVLSDDKLVMEVHDLPIGEKNTKVIEMTFTRRK